MCVKKFDNMAVSCTFIFGKVCHFYPLKKRIFLCFITDLRHDPMIVLQYALNHQKYHQNGKSCYFLKFTYTFSS